MALASSPVLLWWWLPLTLPASPWSSDGITLPLLCLATVSHHLGTVTGSKQVHVPPLHIRLKLSHAFLSRTVFCYQVLIERNYYFCIFVGSFEASAPRTASKNSRIFCSLLLSLLKKRANWGVGTFHLRNMESLFRVQKSVTGSIPSSTKAVMTF